MSPEALTFTYGLGSAISWGAGDFSGGFASKKGDVLTVIFFSQIVGILMLLGLLFFFAENLPGLAQALWAGMAGWMGAFGLVALYKALANGRMGVVAPLSAVMTALVPMISSFYFEGLPQGTRLIGFGSAMAAVWLLSMTQSATRIDLQQLMLPFIAGLGFGLFFVCIDRASGDTIIWPLILARMTSLSIFGTILCARKKKAPPHKNQWILIGLTGILDTAGNAFFIMAAQIGRLDVSAVLASMYPAATVMLAWVLLKEHLQPRQLIGVGTALLALALIAA